MTLPGGGEGEIYATVRVTGTSQTDSDTRRVFNDIGDKAEEGGHDSSRRYFKGFEEEARKISPERAKGYFERFRKLMSDLSEEFGKEGGIHFGTRFLSSIRDHLEREGATIEKDLRRAGRRLGSAGGGDAGIGFINGFRNSLSGVTGVVGQVFNISGRSPLAIALIPALGALVALITAAVYWLQALISLLYLVPSLLLSIGIQGLALYLIFNNMGQAFQAVFGAKSQADAKKALDNIQGLTKEAKQFALSLFPLKAFFSDLQKTAQGSFFGELNKEGQIGKIFANIGPTLKDVIGQVSTALGTAFNDILESFTSPKFAEVLKTLGGSITEWLTGGKGGIGAGAAISTLINGLNDLAIALDPFLDWFGQGTNKLVASIGQWFTNISKDPKFLQWIEDSKDIIKDGLPLIKELVAWIIIFIQKFIDADKAIKERYGAGFLEILTNQIKRFLDFVDSPTGKKALEGFIILLVGLTEVFFVLLKVVTIFFAGFSYWFDFFAAALDKIREGWKKFKDAFAGGFTFDLVREGLAALGEIFSTAKEKITEGINAVLNTLRGFVDTAKTMLYNAGYEMARAIGDGIKAGVGFVKSALDEVLGLAGRFLPHSPAETGPLSGAGDPFLSGQAFVQRLAAGIDSQSGVLAQSVSRTTNSMRIESGAVQINNYGEQPTAAQMRSAAGIMTGALAAQAKIARLLARTL